jgi:hypothetical protein
MNVDVLDAHGIVRCHSYAISEKNEFYFQQILSKPLRNIIPKFSANAAVRFFFFLISNNS